jgi:hypothetical protein
MTKSAAEQALEVESAFLAGVQANLKMAGSQVIAGTTFAREEHDQADRVRAAMVDRRIYDRKRYDALPHGRGFTLRGYERRWIFGKRLKSVTIGTVLAPPGPLLEGDGTLEPVSHATLAAHLRSLVTDSRAPQLIGVCSPGGFEKDVWNTPLDFPNVHVVLIEPRPDGGWRAGSPGGRLDPRLIKLFDPEGAGQKIDRIKREIGARSTDLLTGGISAASLAKQLDVPPRMVETALGEIAWADPELRLSRQGGEVFLYRGAADLAGKENDSMSLAEWVRSLFSNEGDEARKINVLAERRAALSSRLDRMYDDIGKLEKKEQQLVTEGKAATSTVTKRRLAAQIAQMRKDISRCNTSAAVISKQINIISTHIHNLELAQTGSVAQLPSSEELTEAAVSAEEILEQLASSDELVSGLEVNLAQTAVSEDEAAILKELEGEPPAPQKAAAKEVVAEAPQAAPAMPQKERGSAQAE